MNASNILLASASDTFHPNVNVQKNFHGANRSHSAQVSVVFLSSG